MDGDFTLDTYLTKMISAGKTATQHIALACEFLTPNDLELEIDPLTFSFFEDCCDERAAINFSKIPTAHQAPLYRALEKADRSQGIGFGFPRLSGHEEYKDQIVQSMAVRSNNWRGTCYQSFLLTRFRQE